MALELVGITKRFGAQVALDDVSITVADGDCYGFIGHNGAGKTTAMRIALGLQRQDSGLVLVDGFDAARHPREARARLGALIETPGFHGGWSGGRNLAELARLAGRSRADAAREATRWLGEVGLAHAGEKRVQDYSHGMRQRLGIATALLGSPRYVLLDEPTNGLDPEGIAEMRELVRRLRNERGLTFLMSSHQLHELGVICNRVGILRQGRLLVADETTRLLQRDTARWRLTTPDVQAALVVVRELGLRVEGGETPDTLVLDLAGRESAAVTRALFERGVGVASFASAPADLEAIYLRYTRGTPAEPAREPPHGPQVAAPPARLAPSAPVARMAAFDLRRFGRSPGLLALLASPVVFAAVACLRRGLQGRAERGEIAREALFSATSANAFEVVGLALQAALPVLVFVLLGLSSQSLAAELGRGTLRNVLLRPLRRAQCALGKWLALVILGLTAYAVLAGAAFLMALAWFRFEDVAEVLPNGQRFTLTPAAELWPVLWRALAAPLLPIVSYVSIGFLAGAIARSGAAALGLALGAGAALDVGRALMREFARGGYLPSDHVSSPLSDTSYLQFFVSTAQGVSNALCEYSDTSLWVPLLWTGLSFVLAARILQQRAVP